MGDLPAVEDDSKPVVRATATRERRGPFWPGVRAFSEVVEVPRSPSEVRRRVLEHLAPALAKALGEGRTRLLAHGKAPLGVRRGFASLAQL